MFDFANATTIDGTPITALVSSQGNTPPPVGGGLDPRRLGKITASSFNKVHRLTRRSGEFQIGEFGKTAHSYLSQLVAEHATGEQTTTLDNEAMKWGREQEPNARAHYQKHFGKVRPAKFQTLRGHRYIGATPDGIVSDGTLRGLVEFKCPFNSTIHVNTVLSGKVPHEYLQQVLGQILVFNADFCDYCSFDQRARTDEAKFIRIRVLRTEYEQEIQSLKSDLIAFQKMLKTSLKKLKLA